MNNTDKYVPKDPTAWGDEVASRMRAYFEAHKREKWSEGTADNLMISLQNIVTSAQREWQEVHGPRGVNESDQFTSVIHAARRLVVAIDTCRNSHTEEHQVTAGAELDAATEDLRTALTNHSQPVNPSRDEQITRMWQAHRKWINPNYDDPEATIPEERQDLKDFYGQLLDAATPTPALRYSEDDKKLLREAIAITLINEARYFAGLHRPFVTKLDELEPHQYRDQLRYADAILTAVGPQYQFQIPVERLGYGDFAFGVMCNEVIYAAERIAEDKVSAETIAENAVDRILRTAVYNTPVTDKCIAMRHAITHRLLEVYQMRPGDVSEVIDTQLDRSGNLLGWLRQLNRIVGHGQKS